MIRIFSILSGVAILLSLMIGISVHWLSHSDIKHSKQQESKAIAQGLALSVSAQVNILQQTVSKMAKTPDVIAAIESGDFYEMLKSAFVLEQFLPNVLKIRVLPTGTTELDETSTPHMGNADLIMVQETQSNAQLPVIQGQGKNRHLAMTAAIIKNGQTIGIILASLKFDFLQPILESAQISGSAIELKQQNATLAKIGNNSDEKNLSEQINVAQTLWSIHYSPEKSHGLFSNPIIVAIIFLPVLLIGLALAVSYSNLSKLIQQDQRTILKAVKDLLAGKTVGNYPINLKELKSSISTMVQFKRIIEKDGKDYSAKSKTEQEINELFEAPDNGEPTKTERTEKEVEDDVLPTDEQEPTPSETVKQIPTSTIFRAYDIRGIAEKTLTEEIIFDIGRAIASEVKDKNINTIVVGRDGRLSSPAFTESLTKGITSTGVNVLDLGLVPSPLVYFVTQHTEGKSGVVVTASHNPAEYNGLKTIIDGETLAGERIQQIKQRIDDKNYLTGSTGSIDKNNMFINEYIGIISEDIHLARPMKVVIDCGNGATGELAPTLLKTLGCEVIELFCDIDGNFPNHHPDPTNPENLKDLISAVKQHKADLGLAFDGDGDRLGVIDAQGKIIWADRQLMLFAQDVLSTKPTAEIIYDVKCSRHLKEHIIKCGGRPSMCRTGHSFMKAKIKETGAALAGEMSGHIFFNDRWFGFDDALYAAARLIGILSADTRSSTEVFADLPESVSTPEINIELNEGENILLMDQFLSNANFDGAKIITIDGVRADFVDGWGLIRASNTMPALSLRFEADNDESLTRIQSQFKDLLNQIKPGLDTPF